MSPILSTLAPTAGLIFSIQGLFGLHGISTQSEKYYDLSGGLTFLAATSLELYLPILKTGSCISTALQSLLSSDVTSAAPWNWRHILLSGMVSVWAVRLSSFLYKRILAQGHDSRFDEIKLSKTRFGIAWFAQGMWVTVSLLPLTVLTSIPATALPAAEERGLALGCVGIGEALGLLLYAGGLAWEVIADEQKRCWVQGKKDKVHEEEFMTGGLWARCRYPNYFGEGVLWTGMATFAAASALGVRGTGAGVAGFGGVGGVVLPYLSPVFVVWLLLRVSGVPLSEGKYDERFGMREDYRRWRDNTPLFFPRLW